MNTDKIDLNNDSANKIHLHISRFIHHNQAGFITGMKLWFNIYKSIKLTI